MFTENILGYDAVYYYDRFSTSCDVEDLNLCILSLNNQLNKSNESDKVDITRFIAIVEEIRDEFISHELI